MHLNNLTFQTFKYCVDDVIVQRLLLVTSYVIIWNVSILLKEKWGEENPEKEQGTEGHVGDGREYPLPLGCATEEYGGNKRKHFHPISATKKEKKDAESVLIRSAEEKHILKMEVLQWKKYAYMLKAEKLEEELGKQQQNS